jgi:hypothetical protein
MSLVGSEDCMLGPALQGASVYTGVGCKPLFQQHPMVLCPAILPAAVAVAMQQVVSLVGSEDDLTAPQGASWYTGMGC